MHGYGHAYGPCGYQAGACPPGQAPTSTGKCAPVRKVPPRRLPTAHVPVRHGVAGTFGAPPPFAVVGYAPGPYALYATGAAPSQEWASPQKQHFFSLSPAQQEAVRAANVAMHQAVTTLMAQGLAPRWILQTANRFIAMARNVAEMPISTAWDAEAPSDVPPGASLDFFWNGNAWVHR
jgi:hypothetical protein